MQAGDRIYHRAFGYGNIHEDNGDGTFRVVLDNNMVVRAYPYELTRLQTDGSKEPTSLEITASGAQGKPVQRGKGKAKNKAKAGPVDPPSAPPDTGEPDTGE